MDCSYSLLYSSGELKCGFVNPLSGDMTFVSVIKGLLDEDL